MALPVGFDPVTGKFTGVYSPRIQSSRNTSAPSYAAEFTFDHSQPYRKRSLWRIYDDAITSFGNWLDDCTEKISSWITIIVCVVCGIGLVIFVFKDLNIFYLICRVVGAIIMGYILMIGIGIGSWLFSLVMKAIRYIFWNGTTLLLALAAAGMFFIYPSIKGMSKHHAPEVIEVAAPVTQTYECTAYILNVRSAPNTTSAVLGTIKQGETIEVLDIDGGFAHVIFKGNEGYASLKYLKEVEVEPVNTVNN